MAHVALGPAILAQQSELCAQRLVCRDHRAAIANGSEILGWIETEASQLPHRANTPPAITCTVGLCAILDNGQAVKPCNVKNCIHVRRLTVKMHGNDRARLRTDQAFEPSGVKRAGVLLDVTQHRHRPCKGDGSGRGNGCMRDGDDFVTATDAQCPQRKVQRIRAIGYAHGNPCTYPSGEFLLELDGFRPEYISPPGQHAVNGGIDLRLVREVLCVWIPAKNHSLTPTAGTY